MVTDSNVQLMKSYYERIGNAANHGERFCFLNEFRVQPFGTTNCLLNVFVRMPSVPLISLPVTVFGDILPLFNDVMIQLIKNRVAAAGEINTSEMLVNTTTGSLEDFYPAIAIAILMRYIHEPALAQHHTTVVQAITFIFKSLGTKCIPYIAQVVPAYLHVIRTSDATFREVRDCTESCNPFQFRLCC
jgi:Domain of unknown function (DUF3385)